MANTEYDEKYNEMQKYLPFLEKVIGKLKSNTDQNEDNPRKAQLQKMEMLHDLLTNKGKKLKLETLLKCENVLLKLHAKIEKVNMMNMMVKKDTGDASTKNVIASKPTSLSLATTTTTSTAPTTNNQLISLQKNVDITGPASPPPQQMEAVQPVEIPTERISPINKHANKSSSGQQERYKQHHSHKSHHRDREKSHHSRPHEHESARYRHSSSGGNSGGAVERFREYHHSSPVVENMHGTHERSTDYYHHSTTQVVYKKQVTTVWRETSGMQRSEAYSPEECWDEFSKQHSNNNNSSSSSGIHNRPPPITFDLRDDERAMNSDKTYDNTIYKFKKTAAEHERIRIFERLGKQVEDNGNNGKSFENFKINLHNDRAIKSHSSTPQAAQSAALNRKTTKAKSSTPISIPVRGPTIPEVLKSPPLSASDISDLLNESMESSTASVVSISEIGTRRPPKSASDTNTSSSSNKTSNNAATTTTKTTVITNVNSIATTKTTAATTNNAMSNFDMVRKKLAMVTKNTEQFREGTASPLPSSSAQNTTLPTERLALKYHPHRRPATTAALESPTAAVTKAFAAQNLNSPTYQTLDPRVINRAPQSSPVAVVLGNVNVLPTINFNDPRLRKATNATTVSLSALSASQSSSIPSLLDLPAISPPSSYSSPNETMPMHAPRKNTHYMGSSVVASRPAVSVGFYNDPRARLPAANQIYHPHKPTMHAGVGGQSMPPKSCSNSNYSPEENWDSELEQEPVSAPTYSNTKNQPCPTKTNSSSFKATKQTNDNISSSEENWDSEPEVITPKVVPTTKPTEMCHTARPQAAFKPSYSRTATEQQHSSVSTDPTKFRSNQIVANTSPSGNSRFSAVLNDKSERIKYFESKKQKFEPPRTYGDFKKARARAAAEEAAKKVVEPPKKTDEKSKKQETAKSEEKEKSQQSSDLDTCTKPAPESTLDKLYRSANFSRSDFPKTNTSFKIPKKHVAVVEKPESAEKSAQEQSKTEIQHELKHAKDKSSEIKPAAGKKKVEDKEKAKVESKCETETKVRKEENAKTKSDKKSKAAEKCTKQADISKKEEKEQKLDKEKKQKSEEDVKIKNSQAKQKTKKTITKNVDIQSKEDSTTDKQDKSASQTDIIILSSDDEKEEVGVQETPPVFNSTNLKTKIKQEKIISEPSINNDKHEQTAAINEQKTEQLTAAATIENKPVLSAVGMVARRIMRRRATMISFGSAPEVDKHKVHAANALLFEDIHDPKKVNKNIAEDKIKDFTKRNKNLAEMFQKTDDSCSVSTQNILTGKRRTRATINFNEVQAAFAVFKHKKPAAEIKTEDKIKVETPKSMKNTAKESPKATKAEEPTTKGKEEPQKRKVTKTTTANKAVTKNNTKKNETKENDEENQSSAVSSTTPPLDGGSSTRQEKIQTQSTLTVQQSTDNEPSSSLRSSNATPIPDEEDTGRQELLEGFVQDILKPNANTDYIFNLLSQILSEDKLQLVKVIIESAAKGNDKQIEHDDSLDKSDEIDSTDKVAVGGEQKETTLEVKDNTSSNHTVNDKKPSAATKEIAKRKPRHGPRRNELDRLNDDIRDMFISQGVLTATGRRMCTLVAAAAKQNGASNKNATVDPVVKTDKKVTTSPEGAKKATAKTAATVSVPVAPMRLRKTKVLIKSINLNKLRKSKRLGTVSPNNNDDGGASTNKKDDAISPKLRMPVLKPNTPIKLPEEEEEEGESLEDQVEEAEVDEDEAALKPPIKRRKIEVKLVKSKPCPKSKKALNFSKLKNKSAAKVKTKSIKSENVDDAAAATTSNAAASNATCDILPVNLKNTNAEWHCSMKNANICVVCHVKFVNKFINTHYKQQHSENYTSRVAPQLLQQIRDGGPRTKPCFGVLIKKQMLYCYQCPFCLRNLRTSLYIWQEHFSTHTGEYNFECSKCHKGANKLNIITAHIKAHCPKANGIRNNYFSYTNSVKQLKMHVCHLCNYMQMCRKNIDKHYLEQHGYAKAEIETLGYVVDIMNLDGVEIVNPKRINELERIELARQSAEQHLDEINLDDDDMSLAELTVKNLKAESKQIAQIVEEPAAKAETKQLEPDVCKTINNKVDETKNAEKPSASPKVALHCSAIDANVFMPTHDTNDSPTVDILAQSLLHIQEEEDEEQTDQTISISKSASDKPNLGNVVPSMAERLSQRFKDLQEITALAVTEDTTTIASELLELAVTESAVEDQNQFTAEHMETSSNSVHDLEIIGNNLEYMPSVDLDAVNEDTEATTDQVEAAEHQTDADDNVNDDDDNWEDIEITESAPCTSSTISTTSAVSKGNRHKNKNIYQLSRLYASISSNSKAKKPKLKKVTSEMEKIYVNEANMSNALEPPPTTTTSSTPDPLQTTIMPDTGEMGFRSMITSLKDLLPDSPCNDPIELVPELTSLEPLQDLSDITPLLESNFTTSLDTQNLLQNFDIMASSNSICINADNQQTSIQEALDFVTEQQQKQQQLEQAQQQAYSNCCFNDDSSMQQAEEHQLLQQASNNIQVVINRIQNVGFSVAANLDSFKFYCLSEHCTFLYSSEAVGLENHYMLEHPTTRWNGFCNTCSEKVLHDGCNDFPLSGEIKHMLTKHAKMAETPNPIITHTTDTQSNKEEERPRIKLRRLSGDCLSTSAIIMPPASSVSANSNNTTKPFSIFNENTKLSDLLNAGPMPPTRPMPPQNDIPITDPLFSQSNKVVTSESEELFKTVSNDFLITSVASAGTLEPRSVAQAMCPLQIASVCSLSDANNKSESANLSENSNSDTNTPGTSIQLPKISNVCSLNSRSTGAMWSAQIENERIELQKSAAESIEVSRILANANKPSTSKRVHNINDSPEPLVVAETVPIAQATSGDFLITQTMSAQYEVGTERPQLGFNISIATTTANSTSASASNSGGSSPANVERPLPATKATNPISSFAKMLCMGSGCKYQTRVTVAMREHLRFHECHNFSTQRDYLQCSHCEYLAKDVDTYITHHEQVHQPHQPNQTSIDPVITSPSTALTQKIRSILSGTNKDQRSKVLANTDASKTVVNQSVANPENSATVGKTHREQLEETIKEITADRGIPENKLFPCVIDGCKTVLTEGSFHNHVVFHLTTNGHLNVNNYNYKCSHCDATYHKLVALKTHLKLHGLHRHFCYLCMGTTPNVDEMVKHFGERHYRTDLHTTVLLKSDKVNYYVSYAHPLNEQEVHEFGEKLVADFQRKKSALKTRFKPSEIALLPKNPIFIKETYCAICMYKTKVRTNLMRHLLMHQSKKDDESGDGASQAIVANVDPINPVPCLSSTERHFDRMTNLASSSLVPNTGSVVGASSSSSSSGSGKNSNENFKIKYVYVPQSKRFTCGVQFCQYLSLSEDIFRQHLSTLHDNILVTTYTCPFCKEVISKRNSIDNAIARILQHLRFHGQKLYKCEDCSYLHYMKSVIERHINDKHSQACVNLITYDRTQEEELEGTTYSQPIRGKHFKESISAKDSGQGVLPTTVTKAAATFTTTTNTAKGKSNKSSKSKWLCGYCGHITLTQGQMVLHCHTVHGSKHQFMCSHCTFSAFQVAQIMSHIDDKHVGEKREPKYLFNKMQPNESEEQNIIDTTPLWSRDDPKRIRHIRGILMEDEEESELHQKRLRLDEDYDDDDDDVDNDDEVDNDDKNDEDYKIKSNDKPSTSTSVSAALSVTKSFEFGCFICQFITRTLRELKDRHWPAAHKGHYSKHSRIFQYYAHKRLQCPECLQYTGSYTGLPTHIRNAHKSSTYAAADPNGSRQGHLICGYCDYKCADAQQLIKHHQLAKHKLDDIKNFSNEELKTILQMGSKEPVQQCTLCTRLFTDRNEIVRHAQNQHANDDSFSFRQINNMIIYQCTRCDFNSTDVFNVFRHIISHYGKFQRCSFCKEAQTSFTGYMQHCYAEHYEQRQQLFTELHTFSDIESMIGGSTTVYFSNGFTVALKNLRKTQLYCGALIRQYYEEICKISQEPPIPRLSIARLVARKSIEAKQQGRIDDMEQTTSTAAAMQLASSSKTSPYPLTAKKISKRRSTVAMGANAAVDLVEQMWHTRNKKRKVSDNTTTNSPNEQHTSRSNTPTPTISTSSATTTASESVTQLEPYTFYGQPPKALDLSKVYTKIAIAGVDTSLNIDKFRVLFDIDAHVAVQKLDISKYYSENYKHVKKACPASEKHKYA